MQYAGRQMEKALLGHVRDGRRVAVPCTRPLWYFSTGGNPYKGAQISATFTEIYLARTLRANLMGIFIAYRYHSSYDQSVFAIFQSCHSEFWLVILRLISHSHTDFHVNCFSFIPLSFQLAKTRNFVGLCPRPNLLRRVALIPTPRVVIDSNSSCMLHQQQFLTQPKANDQYAALTNQNYS